MCVRGRAKEECGAHMPTYRSFSDVCDVDVHLAISSAADIKEAHTAFAGGSWIECYAH